MIESDVAEAGQPSMRVGLGTLRAVTTLAQRVRRSHPTNGLYEAADFQWWWRQPRRTDVIEQLFWFDEQSQPVAGVIVTEWADRIAFDPITLPGATPEWVEHVVGRGLAHARALGFDDVELEVDPADEAMCAALARHEFAQSGEGLVEAWMAAADRPALSVAPDGYRLARRSETTQRPHHMDGRNGGPIEPRLRQTSLYDPQFDLVMLDHDDTPAAYGLFWLDPTTATGLVEPMRTEDEHQRRGLARHILTAGVGALFDAGASRIKICFEPDNLASSTLYLDVGFRPVRQTVVYGRASLGNCVAPFS